MEQKPNESKFELVAVEIASKTVNPADPTEITKKVGQSVIGNCDTLEEAKNILLKIDADEEEAYDMSCAMAGSSEFVPADNDERFAIEKATGKVYALQLVPVGEQTIIPLVEHQILQSVSDEQNVIYPEEEYQLIDTNFSLEEMFPEGWVM